MNQRKRILTVIGTISLLSGLQPCLAAEEAIPFVSSDEKWNQLIKDGQSALENDKEMPAIAFFKKALSQVQRAPQTDQNTIDRMTAITNVKLGRAYTAKGDYPKADTAFKEAKAAYDKLSVDDSELRTAVEELNKKFKSIDPNSLGDSVTSYLKEANVSSIAVFRKDEGDLVEITLPQKFIKPIDSKDVPKVSFSKKVSFQFLTTQNGDYQVKKIQGMQVLAKSLWVNLLESLVKVGTNPVAEVTAGKMGVTKTVSVNIPVDMYNSTKQILDNLIATIKGQPAYAATGETNLSGGASPADAVSGIEKKSGSAEVEPTADSSTQTGDSNIETSQPNPENPSTPNGSSNETSPVTDK